MEDEEAKVVDMVALLLVKDKGGCGIRSSKVGGWVRVKWEIVKVWAIYRWVQLYCINK